MKRTVICLFAALQTIVGLAQTSFSLPEAGGKTLMNTGWLARRANEVLTDGNTLTLSPFTADGWMKARVPGTVLTTMLDNGMFPAPEVSLNNNLIPDIYDAGRDFYTFWFACPFDLNLPPRGQDVWLNFRGINYKADIFLNGKRLNADTHEGMFLRESFRITPYLNEKGNLLAVIVYPPDPVGNPNGGQGGDGVIARNNTMQFTPGWDWIQPVRDRNTGIWDEVSLTVSGAVRVLHPYVSTRVPGARLPEGKQQPAYLNVSVELQNTTAAPQKGTLVCETDGQRQTLPLTLAAGEKRTVTLKEMTLKNPRLWWVNTLGKPELYNLRVAFETGAGQVSDSRSLRYGVREITSSVEGKDKGRTFFVNGQPVYLTGGNYIASDWLLRLSPERYRDEVRFHAEMNLRMIRVWGGALLERPEFYNACDEYGILVWQDLWGTGDCNGAWIDPMKADSRERRWEYPDNHSLFLASVEDQVKMVRNHPSLCLWCGGNEYPLAKDIDSLLKHDLMPRIDPARLFVSYSTDKDAITGRHALPNMDGPYGIQETEWFFETKWVPLNPEIGNVGSPEVESMRAFMTAEELATPPQGRRRAHPTWIYHRDLGYGDHLERIGKVTDIETYCQYAQVVNYDQYRALMEGNASRMWDWYTGILIWKTQNPWTSLRGQMYDWYLDVNATLYGTRKGCEALHPFYNPVTRNACLLNATFSARKTVLTAQIFLPDGRKVWEHQAAANIAANRADSLFAVPQPVEANGVYFLKLSLTENGKILTDNIYWLTTQPKDFSGLTRLPRSTPAVKADLRQNGDVYTGTLSLRAADRISFFNRVKVFNKQTGERILPVHYSDNYLTLMPGDERVITLDFRSTLPREQIEIAIDSWTAERQKL
jgi:hypothetical protein